MGGKKKKSAKAKAKKRESLAQAVAQDVSAVAEPARDAAEVAIAPIADTAPVADAAPVDIPLVTAAPEVLKANIANLVASSLPKVEHFTVEERVSMGKAVRAQAPLESHAEWSPSPYRVDPVTLLEEQAETRVPGAGPHPLRSHDGLAVRLLPRGGLRDGLRPGLHSQFRTARAGLRRRAPDELRYLRLAGADAHVRHERLRRDAARAVGVGRETSRGQLRGGDARAGICRQGPALAWCCRWCDPTARPCAPSQR